jgi:hypothetical protein
MNKPTPEHIDARSDELGREFYQHLQEFYSGVRTEHPELLEPDGSLDERRVFEGWCIQKIAGLQLLAEYQQGLINLLLGE